MTHGFLLGKFMPLTRGHMHLIESARQQCATLTVLVCTLESEPIAGALRYHWMRCTFPDTRAIHFTESLPSYPHEHPNFWTLWREAIRRTVPQPIDLVFTSEDYGDRLADELGARHICVDKARQTVPISGTLARRDPARYAHLLAPVVADFYAQPPARQTWLEHAWRLVGALAQRFAAVAVLTRDPADPDHLRFEAMAGPWVAPGWEASRQPAVAGLMGRALRANATLHVAGVTAGPDEMGLPLPAARALTAALVIPLRQHGQPFGALHIAHTAPISPGAVADLENRAARLSPLYAP